MSINRSSKDTLKDTFYVTCNVTLVITNLPYKFLLFSRSLSKNNYAERRIRETSRPGKVNNRANFQE